MRGGISMLAQYRSFHAFLRGRQLPSRIRAHNPPSLLLCQTVLDIGKPPSRLGGFISCGDTWCLPILGESPLGFGDIPVAEAGTVLMPVKRDPPLISMSVLRIG